MSIIRLVENSPSSPPSSPPPALWMLVVAQLDPQRIEYSTRDIAPLLGIAPHSLRDHCRRLWPREKAERYYLSFEEAAPLIYRVCRDGRNLPDARRLRDLLQERGLITARFPNDAPRIERATRAILADREARRQARLCALGFSPAGASPTDVLTTAN